MDSKDEDFDNRDEDSASMGNGVDTDMYAEEMAGNDAPIPISQFDDSIAKSKNANNSIEMFDGDAPMPHSLADADADADASSKAKRFGLEPIISDANEAPIPPQYLEGGTMDEYDSRKKVISTRAPSTPRLSQLSSSSSVRNGSNSEQGTTDTIEVLEATLVQEPPLYDAVQVEEQREQESKQPPSESANQYQTWWKKHGLCVFVGSVFIIGVMAGIIGVMYATQNRNNNDSSSVDPSEAPFSKALKPTGSPVIQPPKSWKPTTKPTLKPVTSPPTAISPTVGAPLASAEYGPYTVATIGVDPSEAPFSKALKPTGSPVIRPPKSWKPTTKPTLKPVTSLPTTISPTVGAPLASAEYGPYTVATAKTTDLGYRDVVNGTEVLQVPYGYMFVAEESDFRVLHCQGYKSGQTVSFEQWSNCVQCGDKIFASTVEVRYVVHSRYGFMWSGAGRYGELTWEAELPLVEWSDGCKDYNYPCPVFLDKKVVAC